MKKQPLYSFGKSIDYFESDISFLEMLYILFYFVHEGKKTKSLMKCVSYSWHDLDLSSQNMLTRVNQKRHTFRKQAFLLKSQIEEEIR